MNAFLGFFNDLNTLCIVQSIFIGSWIVYQVGHYFGMEDAREKEMCHLPGGEE